MELRTLKTVADIGQVLFVGPGDFEVIVMHSPELVMCYGVLNKATGIVESITNNYAKAKALTKAFHAEAVDGYSFGGVGGFEPPAPGQNKLNS